MKGLRSHRRLPVIVLFIFVFSGYNFAVKKSEKSLWPYPPTKKVIQADDYHGVRVTDPYRWLEDKRNPEAKAWIEGQNRLTRDYLEKIPSRLAIRERLQQLYEYSSYAAPFRAGEYYFYSRNNGRQKQDVYYCQKGMDGEATVFIDPNALSENGTMRISLGNASGDGRRIVVFKRKTGSDESMIGVREIAGRRELPDQLQGVKFSEAVWHQDGFFYSRRAVFGKSDGLPARSSNQKLYYHRLGTAQGTDKPIFEDAAHPTRGFTVQMAGGRRYLIISLAEGAGRIEIIYQDLLSGDGAFKVLCPGFAWDYKVLDLNAEKFLVLTNNAAPNYRVVAIDPQQPHKENWQEIVRESTHVLSAASTAGGKLFGNYLQDASSHIYQYSLTGEFEREVILPAIGVASGFSSAHDDASVFYTFVSFTYPPAIYCYDIATAKSKRFSENELAFDPVAYETKQVFYTSKDGTKVPIFLVSKKDLPTDGQRPTYLYGYGGFNSILKPDFVPANIVLLEKGGIFAQVNIRGGGEYGEKWHQAGKLENKQNAIDDFIAAAEFLIRAGYTSKDHLAIVGGSNGGLLVAACMTQRPELFKVAFSAAGVMDMLRYQKFTLGRSWVGEYGSSDDPLQFKYLYAYSPLHHVKAGVHYPATLVTASVHDNVVVPVHSYKFIAALQEHNRGPNPVLIMIETRPNRGPDSLNRRLEAMADIWAFMFRNTGGL